MLTYEKARELLAHGRNGRRKIDNNTYIHAAEGTGDIAVKLHATDIIIIHPDNTYTLHDGGWKTVTTKARMNEYSPAHIFADRGTWHHVGRVNEDGTRERESVDYFDGIHLDASGRVLNPQPVAAVDAAKADKRQLDKAVRAYIKAYAAAAVEAGHLEQPSNGDCWGCLMKEASGTPKEPSRGWSGNGYDAVRDNPMGFDHILLHIGIGEESELYFVPSLFVNAMRARGYRNPGFIFALVDSEVKRGDTRMLCDILRSYFKRIKPHLLDEMSRARV